jgi:quercetin dioxygenase-like cupin family protein
MHGITARIHALVRISCLLSACAALGELSAAAPATADQKPTRTPSAMAGGWTVEQLAKSRGVLFAHELKDVPGKDLVVVRLNFPPSAPQKSKSATRCTAHTHPGSVWVYVTNGTARLGIAGEPVHVVHTGESFYEPRGAIHAVAESASATEPTSAIAVMIVPEGAPLATPAGCGKR